MSAEETMYQEAMTCYDRGDVARAKDLLTRLLKTSPDNPRYWLWMSAMVESDKERVYCLKEAQRRDPANEAVRRGLILMGALTPVDRPDPAPLRRRDWQKRLATVDRLGDPPGVSRRQWLGLASGLLLLAALVFAGIFGTRWLRPASTRRLAQAPVFLSTLTLPAASASEQAATPGKPGAAPLWTSLQATYTPTPLYVNTPHPLSEAYRSALRAYARSDWSGVINYLNQAATVEPDTPDLLYYYGEAYRQKGDSKNARVYYQRALSSRSDFAPALLGLARLAMAAEPGYSAVAEASLQQALAADPGLSEAVLALAELYLRAEDAHGALDVLGRAGPALTASPLFLFTRARAHLLAGDITAALEDAHQSRQLDVTYLPVYPLLGEALLAAGDIDAALAELETYRLYQPEDTRAQLLIARAYLAHDQPAQAAEMLSGAIDSGQGGADLYLQRGQIYLDLGRLDAALKDFDTALQLDDSSFAAGLGKGRALVGLGYNGDAYIHFNRIESLAVTDDQKAGLLYWRALALEALAQRDANSRGAAARDWEALLALPAGSCSPECLATAREHLPRLYTPTATLKPSLTSTLSQTPTGPPHASVTATTPSQP